MKSGRTGVCVASVLTALLIVSVVVPTGAQDRLKSMPGYDQFTKMQSLLPGAVVSGAVAVTWADDNASFTYATGGKAYRFDVATRQAVETGEAPAGAGGGRGGRGGAASAAGAGGRGRGQSGVVPGCPQEVIERGRQASCLMSPDGKVRAQYKDRNLWVMKQDGSQAVQVTTDGSEKDRIKYGTASWVYGEELAQTTAMWWSPDSTKLSFYRFDESKVKDFYIQMDQTKVQDAIDIEAFPLPGAPNPVADVFVYDVASKKMTKLDVRDSKPFTNDVVGYYVYDIHWSPDGSEVLLNRTNRRQQILDLAACSPSTGKCRVVLHEEWLTGWLNTYITVNPAMTPRWLKDGKRFIWTSERNGWVNYYLYDLKSGLINPITSNTFEASSIVKIDETAGVLFYAARDGDNYLKIQLHRVGLDGKGDVRLTDPKFTHTATLSPDNKFFTDVYQTHDQPPATQLVDMTGKVVAQLAKSDMTKFEQLGLKKAEQFSYLAADGKTKLYGQISFPSNFDPSKKYPALLSVYGGPVLVSNVTTENFAAPSQATANCEYGFLMVTVSYRGVPGLGKRATDSLYLHLGVTEMDDMAEGVKALWSRPYFDKTRVGIYGTSYGGYTSVMQLLRHPDVFAAASSSSPTTDWRDYDSIYTERYMWLPDENKAGYDAGNALTYAKDLRGRLLLYFGTSDNNVHPSHSLQLIKKLQDEHKSFELQVGPDLPHTGVNPQRMMEFFIENLVQHPERLMAPGK